MKLISVLTLGFLVFVAIILFLPGGKQRRREEAGKKLSRMSQVSRQTFESLIGASHSAEKHGGRRVVAIISPGFFYESYRSNFHPVSYWVVAAPAPRDSLWQMTRELLVYRQILNRNSSGQKEIDDYRSGVSVVAKAHKKIPLAILPKIRQRLSETDQVVAAALASGSKASVAYGEFGDRFVELLRQYASSYHQTEILIEDAK